MMREKVEALAKEFIQSQPTMLLKEVNERNAGIGLVLKLLSASKNGSLTAGEISDAMGVSTARVAVLLKKMEKKGLIFKKMHENDARVTVVCLSEEGEKKAKELKEYLLERISAVIEKMGEEKFRLFIQLSVELKDAISEGFPPKYDI